MAVASFGDKDELGYEGNYEDGRTSAHSRVITACKRAVSCRPPSSIEKTILAKFSAASNALVPSLLYWLVPS